MRSLRVGMFAAAASMMAVVLAMPTSASQLDDKRFNIGNKKALRQAPVRRQRVSPRLNRSQHWRHAETYQEARRIAPLPHCLRPVR